MCCFAQPVISVSDTNLFARHSTSRPGAQLLVYQMKFETTEPNAMILPLPVPQPTQEDSVRFISLEQYPDFFRDLSAGFPFSPPPMSRLGRVMPTSEAPAKLAVHDVGDFVASFVPTIDDFDRLDPQFVIPPESWSKIPEYADYGFAVFQLKELGGKPHPMAFEFATRWADQIFFPTVHIHDGEVHELEQFDHRLYLQHPEFDRVVGDYIGPNYRDLATGWVRSNRPAQAFCQIGKTEGIVEPNQLVHRWEVRGLHPNRDIIRPVSFDAQAIEVAQRKSRTPLPAIFNQWPSLLALIGLSGLFWFFRRRTRVQQSLMAQSPKTTAEAD